MATSYSTATSGRLNGRAARERRVNGEAREPLAHARVPRWLERQLHHGIHLHARGDRKIRDRVPVADEPVVAEERGLEAVEPLAEERLEVAGLAVPDDLSVRD